MADDVQCLDVGRYRAWGVDGLRDDNDATGTWRLHAYLPGVTLGLTGGERGAPLVETLYQNYIVGKVEADDDVRLWIGG